MFGPLEGKGLYLEVVDFNRLFRELKTEPIIINRFNVADKEDWEYLRRLLHTRYEGDTLNVLPSCDCGETQGEYNVGERCRNCGTVVTSITEKPLESTLWMETPNGVKAFINPVIWSILSKELRQSGLDVLRWLADREYSPRRNGQQVIQKLEKLGLPRGINAFYENFDDILNTLVRGRIIKPRKGRRDRLLEFINQNRDRIFCNYLPLPSKLLFVVEDTAVSSWADKSMKTAIDAALTISSIETSAIPMSQRKRESRSVRAVMLLSEYYEQFMGDSAGGKKGWFRKHIISSRLHFTFRAVISSLSDNHAYDELHLPWSMSVMVFKLHLTNKLLRRGMTPNEAMSFLYEHTLKYHPLLDELFKELLSESPYGGFPVLLNRNPSLKRGSIQMMRVTKIKTDPQINTISMSVLALKAPTKAVALIQKWISESTRNCWDTSLDRIATA